MTKAELIKAWQEATQLNGVQAKQYLERLGDIMAAELLGGGEVPLPAIGKLEVRRTAARKGRNPRTGEAIDIPVKKKVALKLGKEFKESLN